MPPRTCPSTACYISFRTARRAHAVAPLPGASLSPWLEKAGNAPGGREEDVGRVTREALHAYLLGIWLDLAQMLTCGSTEADAHASKKTVAPPGGYIGFLNDSSTLICGHARPNEKRAPVCHKCSNDRARDKHESPSAAYQRVPRWVPEGARSSRSLPEIDRQRRFQDHRSVSSPTPAAARNASSTPGR